MPVEQAKNQQPNLGTDQADRHKGIGYMRARGRQIKSEQLWQESHRHKPGVIQFGRLPAFILPPGAHQTDQQAGQDGGEQDHLIRASAIGRSSAEHQHGKC
jgi:hypothetical protein